MSELISYQPIHSTTAHKSPTDQLFQPYFHSYSEYIARNRGHNVDTCVQPRDESRQDARTLEARSFIAATPPTAEPLNFR